MNIYRQWCIFTVVRIYSGADLHRWGLAGTPIPPFWDYPSPKIDSMHISCMFLDIFGQLGFTFFFMDTHKVRQKSRHGPFFENIFFEKFEKNSPFLEKFEKNSKKICFTN
jgi:hypothetical protein